MLGPSAIARNSPPLRHTIAISHGSTNNSTSPIPGSARKLRSHPHERSANPSDNTVSATTRRISGPFSMMPAASATQNSIACRKVSGPRRYARARKPIAARIVASSTASIFPSRASNPSSTDAAMNNPAMNAAGVPAIASATQ
jgi:hypothetical protein